MNQRNTRQKQLLLELALGRCDHPTADQIYLQARQQDGKISRGTVYRALNQLAQSGQLLHVKVPGADRYDSTTELHYHTFCTSCGAVSDAPIPYQSETDTLVFRATGFKVTRHRTFFEGTCSECQRKANT